MINQGHPKNSWYADSAGELAQYPKFEGERSCQIAIVGGGYTGLSAALELRTLGIEVVVLDAAQIGSGASGRNGGQIHTGQRLDPQRLERLMGFDAAKQLWDMSEDAKLSLYETIKAHKIECDLRNGIIHSWHKPQFETEDAKFMSHVKSAYGYDKIRLLSKAETAQELGTDVYHGGIYDAGGGHLHPLKLALGLARAAHDLGAKLYENSRVAKIERTQGRVILHIEGGHRLTCDHLLLCGNGYMEGLEPRIDPFVMPINNFVLATQVLNDPLIIPNDYAVADSRFVVNYFRKTADNRLLFGGGENYMPWFPKDIKGFVRRHMLKIYPQLHDVEITHAWGGTLGITMSRAPFVRKLDKNVWVAAGYSGQGVLLAPYFGKLMARAINGNSDQMDLLTRLPTPPFFGGRYLRFPALVAGLSYYALRDRL